MKKIGDSINEVEVLFTDSTGRQGMLNVYVNKIKETFKKSPAYFVINKILLGSLNKTKMDAWLLDENSYKQDNGKKKILMYPGQDLNRGDLFEIPDWDNQKWLVTKIDPENLYYNNGFIELCNYYLPWVNNNGDVIYSWCVTKNKSKIQEGIDVNNTIITSVVEKMIILPFNDYTEEIKKDQRFLLSNSMSKNPSAYKVTNVDNITEPGIITLVVTEQGAEISQGNDNLVLGIADYNNRIASYGLSITNKDNIILPMQVNQNDTLQLNSKIVKTINNVNNELTQNDLSSNLKLNYISSDETICTIDNDGLCTFSNTGNITITIELVKTNYDGNTEIVAQDLIDLIINNVVVNNYTLNVDGSNSISMMDDSEIYTVTEYNNGVKVNNKIFNFSIVPTVGTPTSAYSIADTTNNTIEINCLKYNSRGTAYSITLNVVDSVDNTITASKLITLVP